jgi:diguanylate cyclase (GGDEF)-like protein
MGNVHFTRDPRYPNAVVVLVTKDYAWEEQVVALIRERLGYEVRVADDPFAAISIVQFELVLKPVILITEYAINPDYNGIQLIEHLKERKIVPIAPYLVHDYFDDEIFGKAVAAGAEKCFAKQTPGKPEYNLGEFFQQGILAAKEVLRLHHAESLDNLTSDPVNGVYVYNQTGGVAYFEHTWREAKRTQLMPSIISFDLVGFRHANEECHEDGDRLIKEVTGMIVKHTKPTDYLIRGHGKGDELALVLPGTSSGLAEVALRRLRAELGKIAFSLSSGKPFAVGFRYGIVSANRSDLDLPAVAVFSKMSKAANLLEREQKALEKSAV